MSKFNLISLIGRAYANQFFCRNREKNKSVLVDVIVLASEAIGDNLVFLDVFHYIEKRNLRVGKKTILVCNKKMLSFWKDNKEESSTELYSVEKQLSDDSKKSLRYVRSLNIDKIILPMHHTLSVVVANSLRGKQFYGMLYNEWIINRPIYIKALYSLGRKQIIGIEDGFFIGMAYEKMIRIIYGEEYHWGLPKISLKKVNHVDKGIYVFFAPYSNLPERSLSEEQMKEILNFLANDLNIFVVLSGTKNDEEQALRIVKQVKSKNIQNLVGVTTFDEYLNLIANAKLVVGTDSGSIHYAASFGVNSVVLCGLWSGAFLPYRNNRYNAYPKVIYSKKEYSCKFCLDKKGAIRGCNDKCYQATQNGMKRLCLEEIEVEDVKNAIISALQDER